MNEAQEILGKLRDNVFKKWRTHSQDAGIVDLTGPEHRAANDKLQNLLNGRHRGEIALSPEYLWFCKLYEPSSEEIGYWINTVFGKREC